MFLSEVPKHWQLAACSDTLFYLLCRRSMDQFIKLLPDGKSVTCLDDLLSLKLSELKKILFSYNEKVFGNKGHKGANALSDLSLITRDIYINYIPIDCSRDALSHETIRHQIGVCFPNLPK